ncbi:MAG: hypothetical protein ABSC05_26495 [Candidatus Solibacter sp.]
MDILECHHLPGLIVGFLCKFVSVVGEFHRSFRMPPSPYVIPFFVVFGGRTMGVRRQFVLLRGSKVCVVRHVSSCGTVLNALFLCTARANLLWTGDGLSNGAGSPFRGSSNCDDIREISVLVTSKSAPGTPSVGESN